MFQVIDLPIEQIQRTERARKIFDKTKMNELKKSIMRCGQLSPIFVTENNLLIAGERRLIALQELGFETVSAKIFPELAPDEMHYIELTENREREDFKWFEEINLKYRLHKYWKIQADEKNQLWGYRESAKKFDCGLTGLSTDLKLAEMINKYPKLGLDKFENKAQAWQAYKTLCAEMEAQCTMDNMSTEEKAQLAKLRSGQFEADDQFKQITDSKTQASEKQTTDGSQTEQTVVDPAIESKYKPIYAVEKYETFLDKVPTGSVGFIELDPPYAIDFDTNYGNLGKRKNKSEDWTLADLETFYHQYLPVLYEKMLNNSWCLCWSGIEHWQLGRELAIKAGFSVQARPCFWIKPGGECNTPKITTISNYETFLLFRKGKATFNTKSFKSTLDADPTHGSKKIHQWEKPLKLYEKLFITFARPGSIFLSPFAGSGNSMIIAEKYHMFPMGCDKKDKCFYNFYDRRQKFIMLEQLSEKEIKDNIKKD